MATTQEILTAAQALGKLIAQHESAKKFEETLQKLQADVEAQRVLNDFNRHIQAVGEKEAQGKPVEVADKQKLEKLQGAVVRNATLRDFQVRQMDYLDLMRKVDEAMTGGPLGDAAAAPGAAATSPLANPDLGGRKIN